MRVGLFDGPRGRLLGAVGGGDVDLAPLVSGTSAEGLAAILANDATHREWLAAAAAEARSRGSAVHPLDKLVAAPPFAGTKILCQVVNYAAHSDEIAIAAPRTYTDRQGCRWRGSAP